MNACVYPPKNYMLETTPKLVALSGKGARKWLGPVDLDPISDICAIIKQAWRSLLGSFGHRKQWAVICEAEVPSPDTKCAHALLLTFPASRTVGNRFALLINCSEVQGIFVIAAWTKIATNDVWLSNTLKVTLVLRN
jgi:hypothetical protein